jgi:hypothetical protein
MIRNWRTRSTQATRRRIALLAAVVTLLLLSAGVSAQPGGGYAVEEGTLTGGGYRLTSVGLPTGGTMSGGGYQLLNLPKSPAIGSGCCCTYLPCILRNQ